MHSISPYIQSGQSPGAACHSARQATGMSDPGLGLTLRTCSAKIRPPKVVHSPEMQCMTTRLVVPSTAYRNIQQGLPSLCTCFCFGNILVLVTVTGRHYLLDLWLLCWEWAPLTGAVGDGPRWHPTGAAGDGPRWHPTPETPGIISCGAQVMGKR